MKVKILFIALLALVSCSEDNSSKDEVKTKLARVNYSYLYLEDVSKKLPQFENEKDSSEFLDFYIQNWIKSEVIVSKSNESLNDKVDDVNDKVENYKKSLLVHLFEQEFIKQKLDTVISEKEIETYYNTNSKNFELNDFIVKPLYFKLPEDHKINKKANTWYKLYNYDEDLDELYKKVNLSSEVFYYDTTKWVFFKDVKSLIPIHYTNSVQFLKTKKHYKTTEDNFTYYLNIIDYKLKKSVSPLSLVRDKIKSIILNQKREKIREQLRFDLYEDAKKTGKIETYNN